MSKDPLQDAVENWKRRERERPTVLTSGLTVEYVETPMSKALARLYGSLADLCDLAFAACVGVLLLVLFGLPTFLALLYWCR